LKSLSGSPRIPVKAARYSAKAEDVGSQAVANRS
jgi:hypothetical protein